MPYHKFLSLPKITHLRLLMQGMAFAKHVFGGDPEGKPDYEYIPSAVFSSPPIANVGLTEEEAVEQYKNVDIFTSSYKCGACLMTITSMRGHCVMILTES